MDRQWTYLDAIDELLVSLPARSKLGEMPALPLHQTLQIRVDRTMPFEFVARLLPSFCRLWGADLQFSYSDYDTALPLIGGNKSADGYIIWLDWRIYTDSISADDAVQWLETRIRQLRKGTDRPIWMNNWPEEMEEGELLFGSRTGSRTWFRQLNVRLSELAMSVAGCEVIDLAQLAHYIADPFYDERNDQISHYPLSAQATMSIARHLGVHLLPALYLPRLKAIALDLDDTLYRGVLGEDGIDGVELTEGHYRLQKLLLRLKQSGFMLTICSRNEEADVRALFDNRPDFPLQWQDFAVVSANWRPKPDRMAETAKRLNISPSAILFIDDNPAELLKMHARLPEVRLLRAYREGTHTQQALCHYPGLYQMYQDTEAAKRTADIQANQLREQGRQQYGDETEYLASLQMVISVHLNERSHAGRLFELSQKTNQFNLALRRMTELEAIEVMEASDCFTMTVNLADALSDSGIVGAFVCRIEKDRAVIIETVFSCRALGRDVETVCFHYLLQCLANKGVEWLTIDHNQGTRNKPALEWLERMAGDQSVPYEIARLQAQVAAYCIKHPAKLEVIE
ncbi:HAD-IIIC family phosphatase [Paenibacillus sp. GCM10027626]|uniref:HAD-IIIC family phosphatase n=1 Tax=Paenibacillus sp. GCM10027626 TaxID=3273411 RepID=UPI003630169A